MKTFYIGIGIAIVVMGAVIYWAGSSKQGGGQMPIDGSNVRVENGTQIITIGAKGGYRPRATAAKANLPTKLEVVSNGTFDCSSAIAIPQLGYRANLPPNGTTEINVPPQAAGTTLRGMCQMGMYSFTLIFN